MFAQQKLRWFNSLLLNTKQLEELFTVIPRCFRGMTTIFVFVQKKVAMVQRTFAKHKAAQRAVHGHSPLFIKLALVTLPFPNFFRSSSMVLSTCSWRAQSLVSKSDICLASASLTPEVCTPKARIGRPSHILSNRRQAYSYISFVILVAVSRVT